MNDAICIIITNCFLIINVLWLQLICKKLDRIEKKLWEEKYKKSTPTYFIK